ncbi:Rpp14/Pop5 family protein [Stetteria hydrogenophila]
MTWLHVALLAAATGFLAGLAASLAATRPLARRLSRAAGLLELALRLEARYREAARLARSLSRRPRRRYIVFEVIPAEAADAGSLESAIRETLKGLTGVVGLAESGVKLIEYQPGSGRGILRVRAGYKYAALAALGLVRRINGRRVLIAPLATTGSIKRARRLVTS